MNTTWRKLLSLVLVLALVLVLGVGCKAEETTTDTDDDTSTEEPLPGEGIKVGMVTDTNGLGDKSFNDEAWAGIQQAQEELGVEIEVLESNEAADYEPNIDELASAGFDIIFTVGFYFTDVTPVKAIEYPEITFGAVDQFFEEPEPNVSAMLWREQESAYVAGVAAGLATLDTTLDDRINEDNVIAFVGGADIPPVEKYQAGYIAGARSVNPDVEVISAFVGNFDDQAKAKELTISAIGQGADIVFGVGGLATLGCIPGCVEEGALYLGVDADQYQTAPESRPVILTSALKRIAPPVFEIIKSVVEDTFQSGIASFGIAEDAGGIAPWYDFEDKISDEIQTAVDDAEAGILDGSVVPPTTRAELD